jgi:hypothetical protein
MADVSVEFGAKDTGLEATLKTVQAEMSRLETEIKSGELSFNQLSTAMRDLAKADKVSQQLQTIGASAAGASPQVDQLGKDGKEMGDKIKTGSDKGGLSLGELGIAAGIAGVAVKAGMALAEAAMNGVRAVAAGFGDAIDLGGRLTDLSSRTGESAGNLLVLERAFTNTGVSAEAVGSSMNKLQKFMTDAAQGGATQSESMQRLGLTMGDLAGKTPTEQMAVFAKQISGIQDPAQRAEAAMSIFGKSGGELLPILNNFSGEIEGAKDQLGGLPGVMDRSAAAFDGVGDSMAAINSKVMEFAAGFLEDALPALTTFTNALSGIDAAGWGQAAMNQITKIADTLIGAFNDPLGAIMAWGTAYEAGYKALANGLLNGGVTFIDFVANALQTQLPSAIGSFITQGFIDSALTFSRYLTEALMTFSTGLSDLPGFKALGQKMLTTLGAANDSIIAEQLANMGNTEAAAARVVAEFGKAAEKTTVFKEDFFGAEEATKRMNEEFAELEASGKTTRENFETSATSAGTADNKILNATNNSAILTNNFGRAATNAAAAQTATENASRAAAKLESSFAAAMGSAYTYEMSTLGAEAALARGAREMTSEQFSAGLKEVKTDLRDIGGEYENLANSGAGIKTIAESLGLDTDEKNPKRLLLEVQAELVKIGNTPVVISITFNEEAFEAEIVSLYNSVNTTFANPVEVNLDGDKSINAVAASASGIWGTPVDLNFEGTQTIQDLRDDAETNFSGPFTVSMSGSQAANDVFDTVSSAFDAPVAVGVDADLTTATPEVAALGDPQTFTLSADTAQAEAAITSAVGSINSNITTQTDDNNIASTRATIEQGVAGIPLTFNFDSQVLRDQVEASLQNLDISFNSGNGGGEGGGEGGSGGEGGQGGIGGNSGDNSILSTIESLVDTIKGYVEIIKDRLPMTALA